MARRSNVPKFGDWENEGNVPYTVYFDKARKNRGTEKPINPNDPAQYQQPAAAPKQQGTTRPNRGPADNSSQGRARPTEQRRPANEPAVGQGKPRQRGDQSFDASPLHRNQQGRPGGVTPGRANPKQGIRSVHDRDDYSSAVPEFGGWENNPESGENYTEKFNKVLQDRQNGSVGGPTKAGSNHNNNVNKTTKKKECLCFSWW